MHKWAATPVHLVFAAAEEQYPDAVIRLQLIWFCAQQLREPSYTAS